MRAQAEWSALPQDVLTRIFDRQHNALDSCAAACVCKNWRLVVNRRHISSLHLHAHDRSYSQHWQAYLSSVSLASHLKLTAAEASKRDVDEASLSWMRFLSTICSSVHVDCCFVPGICHSSAQTGRLTSLTIQSTPSAQSVTQGLPDLRHMIGLRQLEVSCDKSSAEVYNVVSNSLPACPSSLQRLALAYYQCNIYATSPPSVLASLAPQLMTLTSLQLTDCLLPFCGQSISCLSSLKSLSLRNSMIQVDRGDWTNLDKLTHLTHLDVSGSKWGEVAVTWQDGFELHALGQLDVFKGWPDLKVLKLSRCTLITNRTAVCIQEVELLDVTWLQSEMKSQDLHVDRTPASIDDILICASQPLCIKSLVCLSVSGDFSSQVTDALQHLLHQCQRLKRLKLDRCYALFCQDRPLDIVLDDTHGASLTDLDISCILCGDVNLSQAAALTAVKLDWVESDDSPHFMLTLPPTLQSFDFTSRSLCSCQPAARQWFTSCSHLTSLRIRNERHLDDDGQASIYSLPVLPASLYFLSLFMPNSMMHMCDWRCLHLCSRIEHIELPRGCCVPGSLQQWLATARQRHLHIVTFDIE